ncbi:MAG: hypothetical protein ABFD17_08750 [Anaerolineaceae bacterium]
MELKPPLSFEGQIINLKSKNLIIEDESQAITAKLLQFARSIEE